MQKTKNFFVSVVMAFVTLFVGFFSFNGISKKEASALSPGYTTGTPNTIYYLFDYYPSMSKTELSGLYGEDYNIVYDHYTGTDSNFSTLVINGYFSGFGTGCVVVIDIKRFKPASATLNDLFSDLQDQGCTTAFVSIYNQQDFTPNSFFSCVDIYYKSDFGRLRTFIDNALAELKDRNDTLDNTRMLIDGHLVNTSAYYGYSMEGLCSFSPFVRILMEQFAERLELDNLSPLSYYNDIAEKLTSSEYNIKLLVHAGGNQYIDILTWDPYTFESAAYVQDDETSGGNHVCGIGFSSLDSAFYNFLKAGQEEIDDLPVYILEADPLAYGEDGLSIITDSDLASMYGVGWDEVGDFEELLEDFL